MRPHYKRSPRRIFVMIESATQSQPESALDHPSPQYIALIPAAGVGARMGHQCPKQYLQIGKQSVLQHTIQAFLATPAIQHVFVVVSPNDAYIDEVLAQLAQHEAMSRLHILRCGGATRGASVHQGLQQLAQHLAQHKAQYTAISPHDWILVHDAARPGITPSLLNRLMQEIADHAVGGILALPVVDTVKRACSNAGVRGALIEQTVDRSDLWLAQTPQMFRYQLLCDALQQAERTQLAITDEASAVEALGFSPCLVEGHLRNSKLTRPEDLALIEFFLQASAEA